MHSLQSKLLTVNTSVTLRAILLIALFGLLTLLEQWYTFGLVSESSIELTTGLVFIVYIISPYRRWLLIFLLQLTLTFLLHYNNQLTDNLIFSCSEVVTSITTAFVFLIINRSRLHNIDSENILKILLSGIIGALVGGLLLKYTIEALLPTKSFAWITWYLSSITGIVLMAPIVVGWRTIRTNEVAGLFRKSILELVLLLVSLLVATNLIFTNRINDIYLSISFPYLVLPFIFWAAIRFHPRILSLLLVVVSLLIFYYTNKEIIAFRQSSIQLVQIINSVQVFVLFTVVFSYIMAGIIQVRKETEAKVKKLNEDLEERVMERTKVLRQTLGALRQSEEQFREAFDNSIHGMALISLNGTFLRVNQALSDMVGYSIERLAKMNLRKITYTEDFKLETKKFRKLVKNEVSFYQIEKRLIHKDDLQLWVLESNSLIKTPNGEPLHIVSQIVDITERKQIEEQLRKYTETLTVLLREVNHRVKNNLSALIGILHMEEDRALNRGKKGYIQLLREVNSRIRGLATVHSMLSAGNWQPLEISQLCEQIIHAIIKGLPLDKDVTLNIDKSSITIGSNQAHHLTLVINELATNSVKYGLSDAPNATIDLKIKENDGKIHIIYSDNGPGFPEAIIDGDYSNAGIGFELIRGIVTQSLDGTLILRNDHGAVTEIIFANELS